MERDDKRVDVVNERRIFFHFLGGMFVLFRVSLSERNLNTSSRHMDKSGMIAS
jgi:hypothetical protein